MTKYQIFPKDPLMRPAKLMMKHATMCEYTFSLGVVKFMGILSLHFLFIFIPSKIQFPYGMFSFSSVETENIIKVIRRVNNTNLGNCLCKLQVKYDVGHLSTISEEVNYLENRDFRNLILCKY